MKKIYKVLSTALCLAMVLGMFTVGVTAEDLSVSHDFATAGYENAEKITTVDLNPVTFTAAANGNSNAPAYYNSGTALRLYGKNSITITVAGEFILSKIVITTTSSNTMDSTNSTITNGTVVYDGNTVTITAGANVKEVTVTNPNTSGNCRIAKIDVYYVSTAVSGELSDAEGTYIVSGSRSVVLADLVYFRYYFELTDAAADNTEYGLEYWYTNPGTDTSTPDGTITTSGTSQYGTYISCSGLTPDIMSKTQYYRLYVVVDGVKHCTAITEYSLSIYRQNAETNGTLTTELANMLDAAIAYGDAASIYYASR